ncbi:glycosyltransferase [bacterium]|nr:MAG: glycosyltransferase [bacterium]
MSSNTNPIACAQVSIVVPVFNAAGELEALLEALLGQSRRPDEILFIDDGSSDGSKAVIQSYLGTSPSIQYFYQRNQGAAVARNQGWRRSNGDIVVFLDDDCLPKPNWLESMLAPFADPEVGGVGGVYYTLRPESRMANLVGLELDYKYSKLQGDVDCFPTASLALRRDLLVRLGGFNEKYGNPCADDWDLTYKVSGCSRLLIQKTAVVGHYHPESVRRYLRTQFTRAKNRIRLYQNHPNKKKGDSFTSRWIPFQLACSLACLLVWITAPILGWKAGLTFSLLTLGGSIDWGLMRFIAKRFPSLVPFSVGVQVFRNFAWLGGIVAAYSRIFWAKIGLFRKPFMS